jgi:hypothetical protein
LTLPARYSGWKPKPDPKSENTLMTEHTHAAEASELRPLSIHEIEATSGASIIGDIVGTVAKVMLPAVIDSVFPASTL